MTSRADRTIDALRTGHDELAAQVRGFTTDDLTRTSGASDWAVAQVLSHLGSGAEITLASLEGALSGEGAPQQEFNKSVWARWDALSPAEQARDFVTANEKLLARYEGLDADTRERLTVDLGFLPQPVDLATAAGLRLSEFALHSWDVRVAFDPAATLAPEAVEPLLDAIGLMFGFLGKADRFQSSATVTVHTTGPARSLGVRIGDSKVELTDASDTADGRLTTPAEFWLRLITGRHAEANTPDSVRFIGTGITLDDLRQVFPGF